MCVFIACCGGVYDGDGFLPVMVILAVGGLLSSKVESSSPSGAKFLEHSEHFLGVLRQEIASPQYQSAVSIPSPVR